MTQHWHAASQVFDGQVLHQDYAACVTDGVVTDLKPSRALDADAAVTRYDGILSRGFFDIQVNGGGGVLLNADPTPGGIAKILAAHRALGSTAMLPTVITDHPDLTQRAAEACLEARHLPGMMGIHIEGPHIAAARRGTHAPEFLRPMDAQTLDLVERLRARSLPVLITVAPEACTPTQVARLCAMGAVVSLGHSDATAPQVEPLLAAGATCFTHLFNAMSPMEGRAPGVVGAAINSEAWCSIIADGIHVDPDMVSLAIRSRPQPNRMIAVSDAMPTVGGPDRFKLYGRQISLVDARLVNSEGALAGAHLTLCTAIENLVRWGVPIETALRMGARNPAELMGLWPQMGLLSSAQDDLIVLSSDLQLQAVGLKSR